MGDVFQRVIGGADVEPGQYRHDAEGTVIRCAWCREQHLLDARPDGAPGSAGRYQVRADGVVTPVHTCPECGSQCWMVLESWAGGVYA